VAAGATVGDDATGVPFAPMDDRHIDHGDHA